MPHEPDAVETTSETPPSHQSERVGAIQRLLLTLAFVVASGLFVYFAFELTATGRYMPLIVGVPAVLLGLSALVGDVRRLVNAFGARPAARGQTDQGGRYSVEASDGDAVPAMSERRVFVVLAVLFVTFWLFGLVAATFVFVTGYMLLIGREGRLLSLFVGAATAGFMYFFFVQLLRAQVYRGYVARELLPLLLGG
ncbi:hypothetical protein [Egicoccus halophilus]|uniref:Tripartite tricarboxylate transporter TctB family protein n=1 Tax=Egicoccus halophilus TaxID=1670830 RepID=A0A8J3AFM9_9ACTN|nr:hypothetical protein [Egicoccus halophilus]GGI07524.1 hypothetical protein GCM10011354_24520 [Egicoccus halophilus]